MGSLYLDRQGLYERPCLPGALKWSQDNLMAVAAGSSVIVLNPCDLSAAKAVCPSAARDVSGLETSPSDAESNFPYHLFWNIQYLTAAANKQQAVDKALVKSIAWSPLGCTPTGGSLLASITDDHKVRVYALSSKFSNYLEVVADLTADLAVALKLTGRASGSHIVESSFLRAQQLQEQQVLPRTTRLADKQRKQSEVAASGKPRNVPSSGNRLGAEPQPQTAPPVVATPAPESVPGEKTNTAALGSSAAKSKDDVPPPRKKQRTADTQEVRMRVQSSASLPPRLKEQFPKLSPIKGNRSGASAAVVPPSPAPAAQPQASTVSGSPAPREVPVEGCSSLRGSTVAAGAAQPPAMRFVVGSKVEVSGPEDAGLQPIWHEGLVLQVQGHYALVAYGGNQQGSKGGSSSSREDVKPSRAWFPLPTGSRPPPPAGRRGDAPVRSGGGWALRETPPKEIAKRGAVRAAGELVDCLKRNGGWQQAVVLAYDAAAANVRVAVSGGKPVRVAASSVRSSAACCGGCWYPLGCLKDLGERWPTVQDASETALKNHVRQMLAQHFLEFRQQVGDTAAKEGARRRDEAAMQKVMSECAAVYGRELAGCGIDRRWLLSETAVMLQTFWTASGVPEVAEAAVADAEEPPPEQAPQAGYPDPQATKTLARPLLSAILDKADLSDAVYARNLVIYAVLDCWIKLRQQIAARHLPSYQSSREHMKEGDVALLEGVTQAAMAAARRAHSGLQVDEGVVGKESKIRLRKVWDRQTNVYKEVPKPAPPCPKITFEVDIKEVEAAVMPDLDLSGEATARLSVPQAFAKRFFALRKQLAPEELPTYLSKGQHLHGADDQLTKRVQAEFLQLVGAQLEALGLDAKWLSRDCHKRVRAMWDRVGDPLAESLTMPAAPSSEQPPPPSPLPEATIVEESTELPREPSPEPTKKEKQPRRQSKQQTLTSADIVAEAPASRAAAQEKPARLGIDRTGAGDLVVERAFVERAAVKKRKRMSSAAESDDEAAGGISAGGDDAFGWRLASLETMQVAWSPKCAAAGPGSGSSGAGALALLAAGAKAGCVWLWRFRLPRRSLALRRERPDFELVGRIEGSSVPVTALCWACCPAAPPPPGPATPATHRPSDRLLLAVGYSNGSAKLFSVPSQGVGDMGKGRQDGGVGGAQPLMECLATVLPADSVVVTCVDLQVVQLPSGESRILLCAGKAAGRLAAWASTPFASPSALPEAVARSDPPAVAAAHGSATVTAAAWLPLELLAEGGPVIGTCGHDGRLAHWRLTEEGLVGLPAELTESRHEGTHAYGAAVSGNGALMAVSRTAIHNKNVIMNYDQVVQGGVELLRLCGPATRCPHPTALAAALPALFAAGPQRPTPAQLWDAAHVLRMAAADAAAVASSQPAVAPAAEAGAADGAGPAASQDADASDEEGDDAAGGEDDGMEGAMALPGANQKEAAAEAQAMQACTAPLTLETLAALEAPFREAQRASTAGDGAELYAAVAEAAWRALQAAVCLRHLLHPAAALTPSKVRFRGLQPVLPMTNAATGPSAAAQQLIADWDARLAELELHLLKRHISQALRRYRPTATAADAPESPAGHGNPSGPPNGDRNGRASGPLEAGKRGAPSLAHLLMADWVLLYWGSSQNGAGPDASGGMVELAREVLRAAGEETGPGQEGGDGGSGEGGGAAAPKRERCELAGGVAVGLEGGPLDSAAAARVSVGGEDVAITAPRCQATLTLVEASLVWRCPACHRRATTSPSSLTGPPDAEPCCLYCGLDLAASALPGSLQQPAM